MKNLDLFLLNRIFACVLLGFLWSCKSEKTPKITVTEAIDVTVLDPHSYANFGEIQTKHLSLDLEVNFKNKIIYGVARHEVINRNARKAIFDINGPLIQKVTTGPKGKEVEVDFVIGKMDKDSIFGQPLVVTVTPQTTHINIYYQTTTRSAALEWVNSKANPFLYSQGQAILTRTWIPSHDTSPYSLLYSLLSSPLYSLLSTLYSLLSTLYSLLSTLYSLLSTLYSLLSTLYSLLSTLYSLLSTLYSLLSIVTTLYSLLLS